MALNRLDLMITSKLYYLVFYGLEIALMQGMPKTEEQMGLT
jgi:hypothetical protein